MISYAEALSRAKANRTDWNERERIAKAIITWVDSEYEYELEIENEGMDDTEFTETAQPLTRLPASTTKRKRLTMMPSSKRTTKHGLNLNGNAKTTDKPKAYHQNKKPRNAEALARTGFSFPPP